MTDMNYGLACVVKNDAGKILLLKRGPDKKLFPNKWFVVGAYPFADSKGMIQRAENEIKDELGVVGKVIKEAKSFVKNDGVGKVEIFPFLATVNSQNILLNNEHTEYAWVDASELMNYDLVSGTYNMINSLLQK